MTKKMTHISKSEKSRQQSYDSVMDGDESNQISANVFEWTKQGNAAALEKNSRYLDTRDNIGASPLHYASANGHFRIIRHIVQIVGHQELNVRDEEGNTPLHWAVQKDQPGSCSVLLSLGADPNVLNNSHQAPIHMAVSLGKNFVLEQLVSHKQTDVNLEGDLGNTPVILSAALDNHEALGILYKHGAKFCRQNNLGHFPIHAAAFSGAKKSMEVILLKGEEAGLSIDAHINYVDKSCSSPLHLAVRGGNLDIIKLCIGYGAKIDQQQCDKSTALHFACSQGATEVVKIMLSSYPKVCDLINITDGANQTPLHKAVIFDHFELSEYLMSQGANIDFVDCKGHSPLLLATSCGAWRTVNLLLSHGADLTKKDKSGCNFLHLAILQPRGLKNLPTEVLQHESVRELLNDEDIEGCTPLHYACRLGIPDSVKNMLGLEVSLDQKSKEKKSALHFAAEFGRINTCHRLLEMVTDTRLLNEGDEKGLTPLHLASREGHVKVVELLLRKGALFHSDYRGWSGLHHAASEGYTQTMDTLLTSNIKLLNKTDGDGNTALHLAARAGHVAAVRLLLYRGAKIILNKNDASFLHEAVHNARREVTNMVIESDRCEEAMTTYKPNSTKRCIVMDMIEFLPESFKHLLDTCIRESEEDVNCTNYYIEYNFRWLQHPLQNLKKTGMEKDMAYKPLSALNAMVNFNRVNLLTHPVCKKYLEMKWSAYGIKAHLLNMTVYALGVFPLTYLIVNLKPTLVTSRNVTSVNMVCTSLYKQSYLTTSSMLLVLAMNMYAVGKEILQMFQQRLNYLRDLSNYMDWAAAICALLFVVPLLMNLKSSWHWQAGALAALTSWLNLLLYLQRFERIGIYVVMFREISRTLLSIIVLFFYLILGFALSFYALMIEQQHFGRMFLSLLQTFVMMVGEMNYQDNFMKPYLQGDLPFPDLTLAIFVWFVLLVPILLMNLLIGLAVGDIAEVQTNACLKRIAMQIELHTNLEERLPYWFMKRVDQVTIREYPNRCFSGKKRWFFGGNEVKSRTRLGPTFHQLTPLERELTKQKYRLKEISETMEKQHNLLKLIVQKMEISSEADEHDGPPVFQELKEKLLTKSKWGPLLRAVTARKKGICSFGKT
ncbi:transient receptor potential cation channel subfamily A member 1a isoform X2 [Danio rerio]|uniref:Transient receptor potential cation channel subfamily A member 1 n=1 Tax=Danio rerio TaxID=7955 RepID=A0A8M6Z942_DANRE|nr:transient receptor potential cation channel, subfamily A, member 1a isoform X1 [Danio rerio]|eukprot:XP_017213756.1 transient receptor potential cation channel, subfamily A, member 1a isoform X1 [Danio rerio]